MLFVVGAQLPFTLCNLLLALTQPHSQCMDRAYNSSANIARPWFLSMGIIEVVLITVLLLTVALNKVRCISEDTLKKIGLVVLVLGLLKWLIWAVFEIELFVSTISRYCDGIVYAYGLILTILHSLGLLVLCCCGNCRS